MMKVFEIRKMVLGLQVLSNLKKQYLPNNRNQIIVSNELFLCQLKVKKLSIILDDYKNNLKCLTNISRGC
jgi:hypothetical protein